MLVLLGVLPLDILLLAEGLGTEVLGVGSSGVDDPHLVQSHYLGDRVLGGVIGIHVVVHVGRSH